MLSDRTMIQRKTIQCALVYETVKKLKNHATADEIYEEIAKEYPNVGRGTVYRNLQKLSEAGDIKKVEVPDGADRYDHFCENHYHVKCRECGRVFDVDMPFISDMESKIVNKNGFVFLGHSVMFSGICPECLKVSKGG